MENCSGSVEEVFWKDFIQVIWLVKKGTLIMASGSGKYMKQWDPNRLSRNEGISQQRVLSRQVGRVPVIGISSLWI